MKLESAALSQNGNDNDVAISDGNDVIGNKNSRCLMLSKLADEESIWLVISLVDDIDESSNVVADTSFLLLICCSLGRFNCLVDLFVF